MDQDGGTGDQTVEDASTGTPGSVMLDLPSAEALDCILRGSMARGVAYAAPGREGGSGRRVFPPREDAASRRALASLIP